MSWTLSTKNGSVDDLNVSDLRFEKSPVHVAQYNKSACLPTIMNDPACLKRVYTVISTSVSDDLVTDS
jgi:hypothetical protein